MNAVRKELALAFICAGNAKFGLLNELTGTSFKYHVLWNETNNRFIVFHNGRKIGYMYRHLDGFMFSDADMNAKSVKVFFWYVSQLCHSIENMPDNVVCYHFGTCGRCGRELTDPVSIENGLGPVCINLPSKGH